MTTSLRLTLLADGSSDACLLVLLRWLVGSIARRVRLQSDVAMNNLLPKLSSGLEARVRKCVDLYPCDILFVHRDAEAQAPAQRIEEIRRAAECAAIAASWIPVVPVRMTEAWLLLDEQAIRQAAANPNGTTRLDLPAVSRIESLPSPKQVLHQALETASGRKGRRLHQFRRDMSLHVQRVAQFMERKERLRALPAFQQLESDTRAALLGLLASS